MPDEALGFLAGLLAVRLPCRSRAVGRTRRRVARRGAATLARRGCARPCRISTSAATPRSSATSRCSPPGRGCAAGCWSRCAEHGARTRSTTAPSVNTFPLTGRTNSSGATSAPCASARTRAGTVTRCACSRAPPAALVPLRRHCGDARSGHSPMSPGRSKTSICIAHPAPNGNRARATVARVHQRAARPVLRQSRPPARAGAARVEVGRAAVGVLAHRGRPFRRQPRRAAGQPLLRSGRSRVGTAAARPVGRGADRRLQVPRADDVLARRASGRALRADASSPSTPSTEW